jgi:hypothetical protein
MIACIGFLARVGAEMHLESVALDERLVAMFHGASVWSLVGMDSMVPAEVRSTIKALDFDKMGIRTNQFRESVELLKFQVGAHLAAALPGTGESAPSAAPSHDGHNEKSQMDETEGIKSGSVLE